MATLTPSQLRHQNLDALLSKYQDAQTKATYYKDRADSMQTVLDLDPDKNSYTILNWRGESMRRVDLQGYQISNSNSYNSWITDANRFKKDYEDYFVIVQNLDNAEFISANPTLAPALADIAAQQQVQTAVGIAQVNANAGTNALQAKGATELAAANAKRNNIIIIIVVVVVVVSVGLFLWKKFKKS